jgi:hypothetical protein
VDFEQVKVLVQAHLPDGPTKAGGAAI